MIQGAPKCSVLVQGSPKSPKVKETCVFYQILTGSVLHDHDASYSVVIHLEHRLHHMVQPNFSKIYNKEVRRTLTTVDFT